MKRYRVGIVGATGLVGQRLIQRLVDHPWFELVALAASERSAGKPFREAAVWKLSAAPPATVGDWTVRAAEPDALGDCDLVLSGLDAGPARDIEPRLVAAGFAVVSNSSAFRMEIDVPLLVPEVNAAHVAIAEGQRRRHDGGFLVTNPNCSVTGLVLALAPLHRAFGVRKVVVSTMQALSGAGIEGPRGLDVVDNVIPWIPGEEDKMEIEAAKILGVVRGATVEPADIAVSAHCHRVATLDGHLEAVSVALERPAAPEEAVEALESFEGDVRDLGLPSSPPRPLVVRREADRPQPRLDRDEGGGMTAVVGRVRRCPVLSLRFEVLSHNTVRGAAGGTLLNAELLAARGLLPRRASR